MLEYPKINTITKQMKTELSVLPNKKVSTLKYERE